MKKIKILLMVFVLVLPLSLSSFTTIESGETETETTTEETTETDETTPGETETDGSDETETPTDETAPEEETSTDETDGTETDETTPGETDTPTDVTDEPGTTDEELEKIAEENKAFLDSVIQTITDGTMWANILTSITVMLGIVLVVKDKFGKTITVVTAALKKVSDLINKKADSETVIGELQKTNTEVSAVINSSLGEMKNELLPLIDSLQKANAEVSTSINQNVGNVRDELVPLINSLKEQLDVKDENNTRSLGEMQNVLVPLLNGLKEQLDVKDENDKALWTVLTIFMQNVKIPESARAEIMNRMNGIKECKGSIYELVTEAQEAINTIHEEKLALEETTPNLNSILEEVETEG